MRNPRKVLGLFAWLSLIIVFVLASRFFYLQIVKSEHFQEKVVKQRVREIPESPERGKIVDRNDNVMAISLMAQDVSVYPNLITGKKRQEKVSKLLSETLNMPYEKVYKLVTKKDKKGKPLQWVSIAKRVDYEKVKKIKAADLGGIAFQRTSKRYYPNGATGGSILGFVNSENQPFAGIELGMNSYLSGTPGYTIAETDNVGNVIPVGFENISSPIDGQKVKLTIDSYMQYVLEKRLKKAQKEIDPVSMHAVIMNPKTGEIYAMASTPTFDPNKYEKAKPATWTNNAATFVYEPGSTFKPIYMAGALDAGYIDENFTYNDGGSISVNGTTIRNWDGGGRGTSGLQDIIINSSNVGMINISRQMTSKQIVDNLTKSGIGQKTGVQIPGEESGLFPTPKSLDDDPIRKATVSFGQGISVTPVQLLGAFSQIINGGHQIKPTIVSEVEDDKNNVLFKAYEHIKTQKYKPKTVQLMKKYLKANMEMGSGKDYQLDGYKAGAKTGSAWVVENGRYKDGVIIGSFMGFAPFDDPQFAMLVVVNQPKGLEFGGPSAGPIFKDVMNEVLRYKSVPKTNEKQKKTKEIKVPDVKWLLYEDAKSMLEDELDHVKISKEGKGEVVENVKFKEKQGTFYVTLETKEVKDKNFFYMPNVYGKTKSEVKEIFKSYKIPLRFHGEGIVSEQNLKPGRQSKQTELTFWLKKGE